MAKELDSRLVYEVELDSVMYQPNVERHDGEDTTYVVQTTIVYYLLDENGGRLGRKVRRHDLMPLNNPVTSAQFINNQEMLAPLVKAVAIADRNDLCNPD